MSKAAQRGEWVVGQHGPLKRWADNLYTVDGHLETIPIGRVMSVIVLTSGELVIHSAVACSEAVMTEIDGLGPVKYIIIPNAGHTLDGPRYAARYPDARVLTPSAGRAKVEKVVAVHGDYDLLPDDPALSWELLDGVPFEGVFQVTHASGEVSLVFNDALMNLPDRLPGFKGWLVSVLGSTGGPKVTLVAKRLLVRDQAAYREHLLRLATTPNITRIIVGHGNVIETGSAETLRRVAESLS